MSMDTNEFVKRNIKSNQEFLKREIGGDFGSSEVLKEEEKERRIKLEPKLKEDIFLKQKGKCKLCDLDFIKRGISPPDYHHIDGDRNNNNPKNIQAICPNCHRKETRIQQYNNSIKRTKIKMREIKKRRQAKQQTKEKKNKEAPLGSNEWVKGILGLK